MARFTKEQVLEAIESNGMMPLYYHADLEISKKVIKACYDGGLRIFEYTNRGQNSFDNFVELLKYAEAEMPEMILGIGTIYDTEMAEKYIAAGANYIVAPIMNPEVGAVCKKHGVLWGPGVMTVTEIYNARVAGTDFVKIFPGEVLTPAFVKAIKGPMPDVKIMATGGVSPTKESLESWYKAGVSCVGIGSQLTSKEAIEKGDFESITNTVKYCLEIIAGLKK
ncbi:MAG: bifunctional 4-hydroxy-2-oxoglutarate aldolase/2-dehydro-3-deoxy-phosphogluconate aldolase [Spirosomataceae bacterium]